ncbi:hypothetical protein BRADI_4g34163v3 [Brachypodium distachyon]|uniref:Uncharacterized protein n=1 Tax=Brachypodium distachyon TaxID=15368 RepID=A0A0Q3PN31_BRADI|nr:hypothetical protein BRADI_4g34163v3 [Brachypodium distachyon]
MNRTGLTECPPAVARTHGHGQQLSIHTRSGWANSRTRAPPAGPSRTVARSSTAEPAAAVGWSSSPLNAAAACPQERPRDLPRPSRATPGRKTYLHQP